MKFSAQYSVDESIKGKPCLENMDEIEFKVEEGTEITSFGPINNRYKRKTNVELIEAAEWLNEKKCKEAIDELDHEFNIVSEGKSLCKSMTTNLGNILDWFEVYGPKSEFKKNLIRLIEFEDYKEDKINE